jgi:hypothetical protein
MHPGAISGIGLLLLGLGLPRLVDAIEIAYGLDVPHDYGALPWLILEGIGAILFAHLAWFRRDVVRPITRLTAPKERDGFIWASLTFAAVLVLPPTIWAEVVTRLGAVSVETFYQAFSGLLFISAAAACLLFAAFRYSAVQSK